MAYSITLPLQIPAPYATGGAHIIDRDAANDYGLDVVQEALQAEYGSTKMFTQVADSVCRSLAGTGVLGTAGETYEYRAKTCRYDGTRMAPYIWLYVVRGAAEGGGNTWTITVNELVGGRTSGAQVVNGGAAGSGWWAMPVGGLLIDGSFDFNDWEITCTAAAGAGARAVYAALIVPDRAVAVLPNRSGGYTNGVIPIDTARLNTPSFVSVDLLRDMNVVATRCWERAVANVFTSAFPVRAVGAAWNASSGGYDMFDRFVVEAQAGSPGIQWWLLPAANGTARLTVGAGQSFQVVGTVALVAGTWAGLSQSPSYIPYGSRLELRVESTAGLDSVCGWWLDATY